MVNDNFNHHDLIKTKVRHPGLFTPGIDPITTVQEAGWAQEWSGWVWKISPTPGFDRRVFQPVASRYTD